MVGHALWFEERRYNQRAMNVIFHDILGHHMEIYIDDIGVKSKKVVEHVNYLRKSFERMRLHQLKLNPLKCAFFKTKFF